jgi:uncharacterized membrane protein YsdA (DUF1294 family)
MHRYGAMRRLRHYVRKHAFAGAVLALVVVVALMLFLYRP